MEKLVKISHPRDLVITEIDTSKQYIFHIPKSVSSEEFESIVDQFKKLGLKKFVAYHEESGVRVEEKNV